MNNQTKSCQNCKQPFTIEPDDFAFYKKVNVPPPTFCPECRQRRRYAWRNERVLYRRDCDLCGKSTVTIYSPNKPFKVYCPPCWWSDGWDAKEYGRDFDFSRPFFEQFRELQSQVPRIALLTKNSVGSEYTNHSNNNKNCYLSFSVFDSENVLYATNVWKNGAQDSMDCYRLEGRNELLYECVDTFNSYNCQFGMLLRDCRDCFYCYDCRNASNCFLSVNLRSKQYYILNTPHTKEDYFKKLKAFSLGSHREREKLYGEYFKLMRERALHRFAVIEKSANATGNMVFNSRNLTNIFEANEAEDTKNSIVCPHVKDSMDSYHFGFGCELIYESHALIHCYDVKFTHLSYDNSYLEYCDSCHNSENLFGCVGMKQGKYAILNKQYDEAAYRALKEKVVARMRETREYGEFFPPQLSPFGYNETQAQIYMPLVKEDAIARGYAWEDRVPGTFGKESVKPEAIPDDIREITGGILKEVLACVECGKNYNIVQPELQLYERMNLPIPRRCPDCRYRRRLALRQPRKLWHRRCMCDYKIYSNTVKHPHHSEGRCPNEFETSYAPERSEIVYCEQCYQAEVA